MGRVQQRVPVVGRGSGKPEGVLGVLPVHAQVILRPFQGHLVDCPCRTRRDPCGLFVGRLQQKVQYDLGATVWTHGLWVPYCRAGEAAIPSLSVRGMATANLWARSVARATLVSCLQKFPLDASGDLWPQASGTQ